MAELPGGTYSGLVVSKIKRVVVGLNLGDSVVGAFDCFRTMGGRSSVLKVA